MTHKIGIKKKKNVQLYADFAILLCFCARISQSPYYYKLLRTQLLFRLYNIIILNSSAKSSRTYIHIYINNIHSYSSKTPHYNLIILHVKNLTGFTQYKYTDLKGLFLICISFFFFFVKYRPWTAGKMNTKENTHANQPEIFLNIFLFFVKQNNCIFLKRF